jgi:hypothetical protein
MRLSETRTPSARPAGAKARGEGVTPEAVGAAAAEHAAESRALVAVEPVAACGQETGVNYRPASFLAHLIAMKDLHPQTRSRRRVAPVEAIAAYRTAQALTTKDQ